MGSAADPAGPETPYWRTLLERRIDRRWERLDWTNAHVLIESLNDLIAKGLDDLVNERRMAWVASLRYRPRASPGRFDPDMIVRLEEPEPRFLLVGDPGEADASQYAVVRPLLAVHESVQTHFMVIVSDVIYPAGDTNDYINGFYLPYEDYDQVIYGIPGNHDWYDGLNGFMFHFCDAQPLHSVRYRMASYKTRELVARRLWNHPGKPSTERLLSWRDRRPPWRDSIPPQHVQPGPYFAIDAGEHLRIVAIDTGITGELDYEQGQWLRRVSQGPRRKILLTGKPLYVDGHYCPGVVRHSTNAPDAACTVDDIVRAEDHNYVVVVGGDVHNYQRYTVSIRSQDFASPDRRIEYVVAGGGGAYLGATHDIPIVALGDQDVPEDVRPPSETEFTCYPSRSQSLALFSGRFTTLLASVLLKSVGTALGAVIVVGIMVLLDVQVNLFRTLAVAGIGVVLLTSLLVAIVYSHHATVANVLTRWRVVQVLTPIAIGLMILAASYRIADGTANLIAGYALMFGVPAALTAIYVLSACSMWRLWRWSDSTWGVNEDEAAAYLRSKLTPEQSSPDTVPERVLRIGKVVSPSRESRTFLHKKMAELCDRDEPPFYKSFLCGEVTIDSDGPRLVLSCYGVTGYAEDENLPQLVDQIGPIPLR